jgi:antagonist of KipI
VLATVQDLGRAGLQHQAIVPGGAMDAVSLRIANALVGNRDDCAALEIALIGPELQFERAALVALHGARFSSRLGDAPMPMARPVLVPAGARLTVGAALEGAFAYLAVAGGIDVPVVLGARSTHLAAAFGGLDGKVIAAGDTLPLVAAASDLGTRRFDRVALRSDPVPVGATPARSVRWFAPLLTLPATDPLVLRAIDGVHAAQFDDASRAALFGDPWQVSAESNRMGYRLSGPRLALAAPLEIVSQAVCFGTVQVPASGQPIVLMADRQTTGGYPRIAEVIAADQARLAQASPRKSVLRFERTTLDAADAARGALAKRVDDVIERLCWEYGDEND